jgi:hypothetical protein
MIIGLLDEKYASAIGAQHDMHRYSQDQYKMANFLQICFLVWGVVAWGGGREREKTSGSNFMCGKTFSLRVHCGSANPC